jgi:SAM-dependent methyltransferase
MAMNFMHRRLCSSDKWGRAVAEIMPRAMEGFDLGDELLEIGPGYGATTRALRPLAPRITALEVDGPSAERLQRELDGQATVLHGDGADMPFEDDRFSSVVCFTMLHHVPTTEQQDAIFAEANRVLRPGGLLRGSDSQLNFRFRLLHIGDTMNVLPAGTLADRLTAAGFKDVEVDLVPGQIVKFSARKPG